MDDITLIYEDICHELKKTDDKLSVRRGWLNNAIKAKSHNEMVDAIKEIQLLEHYHAGLWYSKTLLENIAPEVLAG